MGGRAARIIDRHAEAMHARLREHHDAGLAAGVAAAVALRPWDELPEGERETHRRTIRFALADPQHHPASLRARREATRRGQIERKRALLDAAERAGGEVGERLRADAEAVVVDAEDDTHPHLVEAHRLEAEHVDACRAELARLDK